jgi:hypothetical protein
MDSFVIPFLKLCIAVSVTPYFKSLLVTKAGFVVNLFKIILEYLSVFETKPEEI